MPMHADFKKVYDRFVKQYGSKKGKDFYYAWLNKKGYDDSKPFPGKKGKELKDCLIRGVEIKELKEDFHVEGLIATSHLDQHGDIIPFETLESFSEQINSTNEAGVCGVHHSEAEGKYYANAEKNAKVIELADGEHGLWVDTKYLKNNPEVQNIINDWQEGKYNSFSITYDTDGSQTCDFQVKEDNVIRIIGPDTKLHGYTATDIPANSNAKASKYGFKELKEMYLNNNTSKKEEKMSEEETKTPEEKKPAQEETEEAKKPEDTENTDTKPEGEGDSGEAKEQKESVIKKLAKEMKEEVLKDILKELKEKKGDRKPMHNSETEKKELESKELELKEKFTEFKEKVLLNKGSKSEQWRALTEYKEFLEEKNLLQESAVRSFKDVKNVTNDFEIKERRDEEKTQEMKEAVDAFGNKAYYPRGCFQKLETKSRFETKGVPTHLTTDDNYSGAQTTYIAALAAYEQSPARYNDIYTPYVVNQLNDDTTTWNLLKKEDWSQYSAIMVRVRYARDTTTPGTYGYGSEPGWDDNEDIMKINLHFVTSYVEVSAEWEAIELARGKGGIDVYQTELDYKTKTLMNYLNGQIFGTGDGTAETAALGFESLCTTSGTIYGRAKGTYATLQAGGYEDLSSGPFTLDKARQMVETVRVNGARRENLVYIMSLRQKRLFLQLVQDMQRTSPTSSRFGFTGQTELDGVPIFEEKILDDGSKTDDIYLIDTNHTKIALKKAPSYVEMAQISLHRRGIIWLMWNLYSDAPNHNYWCYGAATS